MVRALGEEYVGPALAFAKQEQHRTFATLKTWRRHEAGQVVRLHPRKPVNDGL
ncbi:MAG: hypothetical protein V9E81_14180 [Marmoricola sp.]